VAGSSQPQLLGSAEAAERLDISPRTVRRYCAAGLLDGRRVGPKLIKVTEASVRALLDAGKDKAA
jgi:predicted site-specific integrase-resolvase